jgi:hypothetical protein
MSLARERAATIGRETKCIRAAGHYSIPAGTSVDLTALLVQAKRGDALIPTRSSAAGRAARGARHDH